MNNRPQTLYGIVGFADRSRRLDAGPRSGSHALIARSFAGQPEGITPDDFLDNVTFYWLTNTAISSARLYWDTREWRRAVSSTLAASRSRSPSARSPTKFTRRRRAGRKRLIRSSSTTAASQSAAISRRGSSRRSSSKKCARRSNRFVRYKERGASEVQGAAIFRVRLMH